jgi:hypothetical protein
MYRVDDDAIVILKVFKNRTGKTPLSVLKACKELSTRC